MCIEVYNWVSNRLARYVAVPLSRNNENRGVEAVKIAPYYSASNAIATGRAFRITPNHMSVYTAKLLGSWEIHTWVR